MTESASPNRPRTNASGLHNLKEMWRKAFTYLQMRRVVLTTLVGLALSKFQTMAQDQFNYQRCLDVEIGAEQTLDCINEDFRRKVEQRKSLPDIPSIDAHSPDIKIGVFNQSAVKEQYGKNFGHSVIPYRPPTATSSLRH